MISTNMENEEEKKKALKMRFLDILNMINNGCGRERCSNLNCGSHPCEYRIFKNFLITIFANILQKKN